MRYFQVAFEARYFAIFIRGVSLFRSVTFGASSSRMVKVMQLRSLQLKP